MKPSVYTTVASRNSEEAYQLVIKEGYNIPRDMNQLAMSLADIVNKQGESGLMKIANVHPDKSLFSAQKNCPEVMKNADAATTEKKFTLSEKTINIIIVSSAAILAFTILGITIRRIK